VSIGGDANNSHEVMGRTMYYNISPTPLKPLYLRTAKGFEELINSFELNIVETIPGCFSLPVTPF